MGYPPPAEIRLVTPFPLHRGCTGALRQVRHLRNIRRPAKAIYLQFLYFCW